MAAAPRATRVRAAALTAAVTLCAAPVVALGPVRDRVYNPPAAILALNGLPADARLISVTTADGLRLQGVLVPPKDKPLLLVLHGSGASASDVATWLKPLSDRGYGLIVAEYRGFSGNPGSPSEKGLLQDARAFYAAGRSAYPGKLMIVVGHSLGGGVAFDLAVAEPIDLLVTIATFPTLEAVAPAVARPFLTDKYDNVAALARLRPETTYLLLHGTKDETIPPAFANPLHNEAVRLKRSGASFILTDQPHRPDAGLIASMLDYALSVTSGRPGPLPAGVQLAPFR